MGKYSVLDDPEADIEVQNLLDKACKGIIGILGEDLLAIMLVGGYGRGEGGIYRGEDGYQLVNDLDILVFVKGGLKAAKARFAPSIKELADCILENGRGLKAVDMELTHTSRYRFFVPKTVGYYEIATGHQLLYGDMDFGRVMTQIDPGKLPLYEGANYFRNRGSGLLIPAIYFLCGGLKNSNKRKNFHIELQKACQAMGDACLLLAGQYHFSYRERLRRFSQISCDALMIPQDLFERISSRYEWGMTSKLTPCFDWPGDDAMINKWFEVQKDFGEFFLWFESKRMKKAFKEWDEYARHIEDYGLGEPSDLRLRSFLQYVRSFMGGRPRGKLSLATSVDRNRRCLSLMPLLLFSLMPDLRVKEVLLKEAAVVLDERFEEIDLVMWKKMVERFLLMFYPKSVVFDALSLYEGSS